jgi:hypothetical protein
MTPLNSAGYLRPVPRRVSKSVGSSDAVSVEPRVPGADCRESPDKETDGPFAESDSPAARRRRLE